MRGKSEIDRYGDLSLVTTVLAAELLAHRALHAERKPVFQER